MALPVLPKSVQIKRKQLTHVSAIHRLHAALAGPGRYIRAAEQLRAQADEVATRGYVALKGRQLVGSVQVWHIRIGDVPALLLGPLLVAANMQGQGIGRHLLARSLARCDTPVLLVGDAPYYATAGFESMALLAPPLIFPVPVARARVLIRLPKGFAIAQLTGKVKGIRV